jgi:hypothetical protein
VGTSTDAARAEVLRARGDLGDELTRLEAAGRAAVDIPSKIRRAPAKTAGLAAGAAFLVVGGPAMVARRLRRAVLGPEPALPPSLLPEEVDKALRKLGTDGEKVRGTLEREFAQYLEEHTEERRKRDVGALAAGLLAGAAKPVTIRAARRMADELFRPDAPSFGQAVERIRARRDSGKGSPPGS